MRVYIIRHGETDWNSCRRLQGRSDIPLNERGIALAQESAEGMRDIPFDRVFTSPLIRARKTAEIIADNRQIPVVEEPRIQEISFGILEGKIYNPQAGMIEAPELENFFEHPEVYACPPGGETISALIERTGDFLNELVHTKAYEQETILVVCHGAALRGLLANVKGIPISAFWKGGVHKNCSVTILESHEGVVTILEEGRIYYRET